jgi:hypothetical protein
MNSELLDILNASVTQGHFCTSGVFAEGSSLSDLELDIKELGSVPLPVTPEQAEQIIRRCQRAPYGLGHKTLVDVEVRNVWELGPRKFTIKSSGWKKCLSALVKDVGRELGLEGQNVKARLDKLLVYEKGSFFVNHQDTEKTAGMFATLVVSLPSRHTGGALLVSHNDEDKKIAFGGKKSADCFQYAAFYADCLHEIKPIVSGYRICLVYNLSLPQKKPMPLSGANQSIERKVTALLNNWVEKTEQPAKKVFLFDHQYTPAEISLTNLKNKDCINGEILYQAARKAQCEVHLALITFHQNGEPEGAYDDYHRGSYYGRRRYYYDDYDDEDAGDGADYEMGEIFDQDLRVTQWFDVAGRAKDMGHIAVSEEEIIANIDFTDNDPDESEYEGYMGNYGPSLDRWYHRAALVLWPRIHNFSILVQAGPAASVPDLSALTEKMLRSDEPEKTMLLEGCRSYASTIMQHGEFKARAENPAILLMLKLLPALADEDLAREFFQSIFSQCFYGDEGKALAGFLDALGWETFEPELIALFAGDTDTAYKKVRLLKELYENLTQADVGKTAILKLLAERVSNHIDTWDKASRNRYYFHPVDKEKTESEKRIELIRWLIEDCFSLFTPEALNRLITYFTSTEKYYPLHEVLLPLLEHYKTSVGNELPANPAIEQFVTSILAILRSHTRAPIEVPTHWKMDAVWKCDCKDCVVLKGFLRDPSEKTLHVKMAKERRKHMHNIINAHVIDVTHETIRKGSPYTLVFEKNRNSYAEKQRLWQKELEILTDFQESENWFTRS